VSPPGSSAGWGLRHALFGFLVGTLLSALAAQTTASAIAFQPGHGRPVPLAVTVAGLVGLWLGLLGGVVWASWTEGSGRLGVDYGLVFHWPFDLIVGVIAGLGTQVALIPALYLPFELADPSLRRRLEAPAKSDTGAIHGNWQIAALFLVLAVGAPVVEELFFRGLLQRSLAARFGPTVAIAGSAVAFGLAHFQALQLPALVLFGLILAFLAQRSGRLGPGIVAHAAFNAFTVLTLTVGK